MKQLLLFLPLLSSCTTEEKKEMCVRTETEVVVCGKDIELRYPQLEIEGWEQSRQVTF
jgi:hypothetical protein